MLDQILALVKEHGQSTIVNNPDVPNQHNDEAINVSANAILNGLQSSLSQGGLPQLIALGCPYQCHKNKDESPEEKIFSCELLLLRHRVKL